MARRNLGSTGAQARASAPASPVVGQFYWDTATGLLRVWNGAAWVSATSDIEVVVFAFSGTLSVRAGKSRVYLEHAYRVESIRAAVDGAPAGAAVLADVNANGTTIFGTQANRPTITAGANTGLAGAASGASLAAGQYLTVDVDQVGSTAPGSDLTVTIRLRRT